MQHKILLLLLSNILFLLKINAQSISLGNDTLLSNCQSCITLKSNIYNPNAGASNYIVQQIPYNAFPYVGNQFVPYNYTINATAVTSNFSDTIDIPFNFCFYSQTFNKCILTHGTVSFNAQYADSFFISGGLFNPLPTTSNFMVRLRNCIFAPYHNSRDSLDLINQNVPARTFQVYGVAPNRAMVLNWYNSCHNGTPCYPIFPAYSICDNVYQVVLYEGSNIIQNNIANFDYCNFQGINMAQGIMNGDGTQATVVPGRNFPNIFGIQNESWVYIPNNHTTYWYDGNHNLLATGVDSLPVCPSIGNNKYYVTSQLTQCGGNTVWVSDTVYVNKLDSLKIQNVQTQNATCYGVNNGSVQFLVSNGVAPNSYTLNGNAMPNTNIQNLAAGTYTIQVTDAQMCTATELISISAPTQVNLQLISQKNITCKGKTDGELELLATGGSSPYEYKINQGNWSSNPMSSNLSAGIQVCYAKDQNSCQDTLTTTLTEPESALSISTEITHRNTCKTNKEGRAITYTNGGTPPYSYVWNSNPPSYYNVLQFAENGLYEVKVSDATGCTATASVDLKPTLYCGLQVPTAFTPNKDGLNETFKINDFCGGIIAYQIKIFNRWGNMVYSSRDIQQGWDGNYLGVTQSNDVFSYYIEYTCQENTETKRYLQKGEVLVLK